MPLKERSLNIPVPKILSLPRGDVRRFSPLDEDGKYSPERKKQKPNTKENALRELRENGKRIGEDRPTSRLDICKAKEKAQSDLMLKSLRFSHQVKKENIDSFEKRQSKKDDIINERRQAISLQRRQIQQGVAIASGKATIAPSPFPSSNDDTNDDDNEVNEEATVLLSDRTSKAALTNEQEERSVRTDFTEMSQWEFYRDHENFTVFEEPTQEPEVRASSDYEDEHKFPLAAMKCRGCGKQWCMYAKLCNTIIRMVLKQEFEGNVQKFEDCKTNKAHFAGNFQNRSRVYQVFRQLMGYTETIKQLAENGRRPLCVLKLAYFSFPPFENFEEWIKPRFLPQSQVRGTMFSPRDFNNRYNKVCGPHGPPLRPLISSPEPASEEEESKQEASEVLLSEEESKQEASEVLLSDQE